MIKAKYTFLFLLLTSICFAQSGSASASVTANVITPITIITTGSIDFGDVIVMPNPYQVTKSPESGSRHEVQGNPNSSVTISFNPITLDNFNWVAQHGGTSGTITFIPEVKHTGTNPNYVNPITVTSGGVYQLTDVGGIGKLYLWVGGAINVNANQPVGYYTGTFVINVSY
ncbi:MAG: DUF4402 domain-containing protein [Melioribacteraceae bacterium]